MGNFNKDIYTKGCRLITKFWEDTKDIYQFVFNAENNDISDVLKYENGLEFELTEDGLYRLVTLKVENATVENNCLQIGDRDPITVEQLKKIINGEEHEVDFTLNKSDYDVDDVLSICNLKKCLAELELK